MYHDVTQFRDFYYGTALGRMVQTRLQKRLRAIWGDVQNEIIIGYGFASPILRPFLAEASHVVNLMPAEQGVMAWPPGGQNVSALCMEGAWPLGASSVDKVIALHALENAENVNALLNEIWRVLAPDGRVILVITNRLGVWATRESTPFGHGRHFSMNLIEHVLRTHQFEIISRQGALFGTPARSRLGLRLSKGMAWFGERAGGKAFAGVWLLELKKSEMGGKAVKLPKREPIFAHPELRPARVLQNRAENS